MIASQGKKIGPIGLEPPAVARNRRKATVKATEETQYATKPTRSDNFGRAM